MTKKHRVTLAPEEREFLNAMIRRGRGAARKLTRSRILLKCDEGSGGLALSDDAVADALDVGDVTAAGVRKCFVEQGLDGVFELNPGTRQ